MKDFYYTLKGQASTEIKIKGSRFISVVQPVITEEAAESLIHLLRKKHYDATHNCTAFRLGRGEPYNFRYNDDGEPSGTAGRPIFEAITARSLTNVVCIVTRYYGGTKLGTGGLARAYGGAAGEAFDKAGRIEKLITADLRINFNYDLTGVIMNRLSRFEAKIIETIYSDNTELIIQIRCSKLAVLQKELINAAAGKIIIHEESGDAR